MNTRIFGSDNLSLDATLSEARTDDYTLQVFQLLGDVFAGNLFTVHKVHANLHVVVDACQVQTFADALVCILQVVLTHQADMYLACCLALLVKEVVPGFHGWRLTNGYTYLPQDGSVQSLLLHVYRHLVDAWHIFALHHALQIDITERSHLHAQMVIKVAFGSEHKDVGLNTHRLQFLDTMLRRFCLQFVSGFQIGNVGQVHAYSIASQLPP